jgi:hypothetical protein
MPAQYGSHIKTPKIMAVPVQMSCLFDQHVVLQRTLIQVKITGEVCDFCMGLEMKTATNKAS